MFTQWLVTFTLLTLVHGNGPKNPAAVAEQRAVIRGKVLFVGDVKDYTPMPVPPPHSRDSYCSERHRRDPIVFQDVMLNVRTDPVTIRNVIVSLRMLAVDVKPSESPVVVEMRGCVFRPHVVALQAGQTLRIVNADDNLMNVHLHPAVNPEVNYNRPRRGEQLDFQLKAEPPFRVGSDIYPWTLLWVEVFDHPYFAVTGEDGSFQLPDVPPGKYTLEAWHEKFGTLRSEVELKPGETKSIDFTFEPKPAKP